MACRECGSGRCALSYTGGPCDGLGGQVLLTESITDTGTLKENLLKLLEEATRPYMSGYQGAAYMWRGGPVVPAGVL